MRRSLPILALTLALIITPALAQWNLQQNLGNLEPISFEDVFNDTIKYDDGAINWWYNGLTNFRLATKFTPAAAYHLQRIMIALDSSSTAPITIFVKNDSAGFPGGTPLWSGNLFYNAPYTWLGLTVDTLNLPQYHFSAGTTFWIEIRSNGPPFEIYDASPTLPTRSKTWFAPWGGWVNSPGDNFIRVAGEYSTSIVDAGCDSIWHGGNFFLPNPSSISVSARVKNFGSSTATFNVACSLFTELGGSSFTFFQALTPQTVTSLASGGFTTVNFPSVNLPTSNRYRLRVRTLLAGDGNPDNNAWDTETLIYTAPAELRYDDTLYANAAYALTGNGWAMKFNPHQTGNYTLDQFKVMAQFANGDSAARIQVLDDNGASGAPGTILYQTVAIMTTGWNAFNVSLANQTGSFYVAYIFEHGTHTSALRYDDYPSSGQGWSKSGAIWIADASASDWMIRATISSSALPPSLDVTLTPVNPPITIPANGGSFQFNTAVARTVGPQAAFWAWARMKYPNGTYSSPTLGPVQINPPVGVTITRLRIQNIPSTHPAGVTTYLGYANTTFTYPAIDSSSFTFTKLVTVDNGPWVNDYTCSGELFPGEEVTFGEIHPSAFLLYPCSPNPFNPTTAIRYQLSVFSHVSLRVYNTTGRLIAELVNGGQQAGIHQVTFDGSRLASGLYFLRMQEGDFSATQKLMLVK
jgi:hypothetical protein